MATKRIRLTRLWDGHPAGEIVTEQDFTVDSMVRKGYGKEITKEAPRSTTKGGKGPKVETTDAKPLAETADVTPQAGGKAGN